MLVGERRTTNGKRSRFGFRVEARIICAACGEAVARGEDCEHTTKVRSKYRRAQSRARAERAFKR